MNLTEPKKVIQIASDADAIAVDRRYYTSAENLSKQLSICSYEYELPALKKNLEFFPSEHEPELGDTYIRSPFDKDVYIRLENYEDYLLRRKISCMSRIAQCLGASNVNFTIKVDSMKKRNWDSATNGNYMDMVECDVEVAKKQSESLSQKYMVDSVYDGIATSENYDEAVKYAQECHLVAEPDVKFLLEGRKTTEVNRQKHYKVTFSMSEELNEGLNVACSLGVMDKVFSLTSSFKEATKYEKKLYAEFVIDFEK